MDEIANKAFDFVNEAEARQGALKKTAPRPSGKPAKDKVEAYWEGIALPAATEQLIRQHFEKIEALKIPKGYRTAEIELWFPDGVKRVPYLSFIAELVTKDILEIKVATLLSRAEVSMINRMDGSELIALFTRNGNTITPVEMVHTDDYSEVKGVV